MPARPVRIGRRRDLAVVHLPVKRTTRENCWNRGYFNVR